ncbi:hypothetical protein [Streptomyces sp. ICBB 8177]|uniref:hypothetical protein n=1 Tax=Streptomyces sp. ICBB 8177 TaxID=563922 RepID=UPI001305089C|nr:hypothetical protein [Streptomyces sp. ICBB 8177]
MPSPDDGTPSGRFRVARTGTAEPEQGVVTPERDHGVRESRSRIVPRETGLGPLP